MKKFFNKISCFFGSHDFKNQGEEKITSPWMPWPCDGEIFQPQQCSKCDLWRDVWVGFTWAEKEKK